MAKRRASVVCTAGMLAVGLLACGDDDGDGAGGGSGGGGSYSGISESLAKPSGKLAADNAVNVAESYEQIYVNTGEKRLKQASTQSCGVSGTTKTTVVGASQTSGHAVVTYDNCCHTAGCCMNGDADWFYATGASEYPYCGRYDITSTCNGSPSALKYEGCFGTGGWVLLVKVDGKSYAVTGAYANGSGRLTIKDSASSWTCTYTNNTGSCTGGAAPISF